jgi:hypothetical protein
VPRKVESVSTGWKSMTDPFREFEKEDVEMWVWISGYKLSC